jgi:toxin ParE1/3/4
MTDWTLSEKAADDLIDIYVYTFGRFGERQAEKYTCEIEDTFAKLAAVPGLGRSAGGLRSGLSRFEHAHHVIFYRLQESGMFVVRVLHERMDADQHLSEE